MAIPHEAHEDCPRRALGVWGWGGVIRKPPRECLRGLGCYCIPKIEPRTATA